VSPSYNIFLATCFLFFISCSPVGEKKDIAKYQESGKSIRYLIGESNQDTIPIDLNSWEKTPSVNNRIATEEDVMSSRAIFVIENDDERHTWFGAKLPKLALLTDSESIQKQIVVVIQIENSSKGPLAGYKFIKGGFGACFLYELEFISLDSAKTFINKNLNIAE
jgi:hypothetical protein